jgi:hypothetical protein
MDRPQLPRRPSDPLDVRLDKATEGVRSAEEEARDGGTPAPWLHALPPLYVYALDELAVCEGGRFTSAEAAEALDVAALILSAAEAPPYGPQPDAGDVGAFVATLVVDELARPDGAGGYVLDLDRLPF